MPFKEWIVNKETKSDFDREIENALSLVTERIEALSPIYLLTHDEGREVDLASALAKLACENAGFGKIGRREKTLRLLQMGQAIRLSRMAHIKSRNLAFEEYNAKMAVGV